MYDTLNEQYAHEENQFNGLLELGCETCFSDHMDSAICFENLLYALAMMLASRNETLTLTLMTKSGNDLNEQNKGFSSGCNFD